MTEQETEIKRVISYIRSCRDAGIDTTITIDKSRNHLILNALEEIQKYRALGTVEQLMDMKKDYVEALSDWRQYRKIGTLEELREVREKQVSKKPIRNDLCTCPSCGTHNEVIKKRRNTVNNDIVYCWHCGQAMEVNRLE